MPQCLLDGGKFVIELAVRGVQFTACIVCTVNGGFHGGMKLLHASLIHKVMQTLGIFILGPEGRVYDGVTQQIQSIS